MATVQYEFITGLSVGFEYVEHGYVEDDDVFHYIAVDLFILRLVFAW